MNPRAEVTLASHTTFGIGGPARYFIEATTDEDVTKAAAFAKSEKLPLFVLGGGSNILIPDAGVEGVVLHVGAQEMRLDDMQLIAAAGSSWDTVVETAVQAGLHGIENLAGIPGTIGGAAVQNIGAYGAELAEVFAYADVFDTSSRQTRRISKEDAAFGYRTSYFKQHREIVVLRVALTLAKEAPLNVRYADLVRAQEQGVPLKNPADVAKAVRAIRARKFPDLTKEGTAGSFFKNPVVTQAQADALCARFPVLPAYPQSTGGVKLSLAWLLDHALGLKGYAHGRARLFEKQPLVVVAQHATSEEVEALATFVQTRVQHELGIDIEREVETFAASRV